MSYIYKSNVTMGKNTKPQEDTATGYTDVDDSSETRESSDTESFTASLTSDVGCGNLNCSDYNHSRISEANSELIDWMVNEYWKGLTSGMDVQVSHLSEIIVLEKRLGLFIGDREEKHAAYHKVYAKCAECYYMELRHALEDTYYKQWSTKNLYEMAGSYDNIVAEVFVEVDFNTPESKAIWLEEREYLRETLQSHFLARIASLTKAKESWLEKVTKQQYEYFEMFTLMATEDDGCHWIEIKKEDDNLLELIGYAVYRKTHQLDKYAEEELEKINPIAKQIRRQSFTDPVQLSCIFIIYQLESNEVIEPVFRIKNSYSVLFVDINQRVYKDWDDFKNNNKLPECLFSYPLRGEYNKKKGFQVTFSWSPASFASKKVANVLNVVGKVVTIGSSAALGAAAALPTLPLMAVGGTVAAVTSGAYGINRGVSKIWNKMSYVQSVNTQDVVNVLSNAVSVASGVAEVVPALATMGSSMLFTQSAVQGMTAITTLVPEYEDNNNVTPQSGELSMKTLLFFNSKSPEEAINKIKESYDLASDQTIFFVIKTLVLANSVEFASQGKVQKYFSKSLTSLVLDLLDAVKGGVKSHFMDTLFLRDVFSYGELTSLNRAFTDASKRAKTDFFRLLIDSVCKISSQSFTSVPLRSYRGVEFHPVSEVFEQIDFSVIAKGCFSIDRYLDAATLKKLQTYVIKMLTLISSGDEKRGNCSLSLSEYTDLIKTNWPEIRTAFDSSKGHKQD